MVTIQYNGKTTQAQVVDMVRSPLPLPLHTSDTRTSDIASTPPLFLPYVEPPLQCQKCPYGGLDLSVGVFDYFTWPGAAGDPVSDPGVIYGSWWPSNGGGSAPPPPPPSSGGSHRIHPNGNPNKCLDVVGANYANGTPVDMYVSSCVSILTVQR